MEKRIPRRRFKEFIGSGDWEEKKFGCFAIIRRGLTYSPSDVKKDGIIVLRSSNIKQNRFVLNNDDVFVKEEAVNIDLIKENDILITSANGSSHLVGKHALVNNLKNKAVHGGFMLIASAKKPFFINALMSSAWYVKFIKKHIAGGNGAIGNLKKNDLENDKVFAPSLAEQEKIGDFFQKLDRLIDINRDKLDKLKASKSAYLTEMFPREGEDRPRRRFQGFTGEWEEKKIRDIFRITRGNVLATTMTSKQKSDYYCYPVYSSQTLNNGLMGYYNDYLYEDSITWTTDGANAGTVKYRSGKFYCTNVCGVLLSNEGYSNKMVAEVLNKVAWQYVSKVGNPKLMNNIMGEIIINIPSLAEQEKIGNFFQKLDDQIGLQEEKLEKLEKMKKAYLAEMFV